MTAVLQRHLRIIPSAGAAAGLLFMALEARAVDVGEYDAAWDEDHEFCAAYPDAPPEFKARYRERWATVCDEFQRPPQADEPRTLDPAVVGRPDLKARIELAGTIETEPGASQSLYVWAAGPNASGVGPVDIDVVLSTRDFSAVSSGRTGLGSAPIPDEAARTRQRITVDGVPAQRTVAADLPADLPEGVYYWCAFVDPDDRVRELSERNNAACVEVDTRASLDWAGDLWIERTNAPDIAPPGSVLPLYVYVRADRLAPFPFCIAISGPNGERRVVSEPQTMQRIEVGVRMNYRLPEWMPERYPLYFLLHDCGTPELSHRDENRANNEHLHWVAPQRESYEVTFNLETLSVGNDCADGQGGDIQMAVHLTAGESMNTSLAWPSPGIRAHQVVRSGEVVPLNLSLTLPGVPGDGLTSLRARLTELDLEQLERPEREWTSTPFADMGRIEIQLGPLDFYSGESAFDQRAGWSGWPCGGDWSLQGTWTATPQP